MEKLICPVQEPVTDEVALDDAWEAGAIPDSSSEDWFRVSQGDDVSIKISGNTIVGAAMNPEERLFNYSSELRIPGGIIAGYDHGEFGGKVSFIPGNGNEHKLINENFKGFYVLENKIFVLTGFSHMFTDKGHVYEINYGGGKLQALPILDLDSCPESYLLVDKILYLATNKALLVVENRKITKLIAIEESWVGLYPNSLVLANSKLYVGMRGGMVSVGLNDKKITWYYLAKK